MRLTEILETFPRVFCFRKSRINENGGTVGAATVRV